LTGTENNDLEHQDKGFSGFFGDFWLRHTFQVRIAPKSPETDWDSLHMKLSALNIVFIGLNFAPLRSRNSPYGDVKLEYLVQCNHIRSLERQQPCKTVAPSGVCQCIVPNVSCWDWWA